MTTVAVSRVRTELGLRWRFAERHRFVDRRRGAKSLLIVLAGHKPALWPATLARLAAATPADHDACLVCPGVDRPELEAWAAEHGWSYLTTSGGHVSVGQNLAIRAHPDAERITKVDEDVFVPPGFVAALAEGHRRAAAEAEYLVGFAAPMLNVNGFSYVDFLRLVGAEDEYRERFGELRRASDGIPAQADGEAAVFLWERGFPVDEVARRAAAQPFSWSIVPHRFSIGAIHFERTVWETMRAFKRHERAPGLGEDEQHLCVECLSRSRAMVVINTLYAGHFAFGGQMPSMLGAFGDRIAEL